jgi:hypothetical protein
MCVMTDQGRSEGGTAQARRTPRAHARRTHAPLGRHRIFAVACLLGPPVRYAARVACSGARRRHCTGCIITPYIHTLQYQDDAGASACCASIACVRCLPAHRQRQGRRQRQGCRERRSRECLREQTGIMCVCNGRPRKERRRHARRQFAACRMHTHAARTRRTAGNVASQ